MKRSTSATIFAISAASFPVIASAQLRIVQYNTGGAPRTGLETILQQIGNEQANGFAKPIDVLLMQEVATSSDLTAVVNLLNSVYGANTYAAAPYIGQTLGGGLPAMVYRNASVDLVGSVAVGSISTSGNARQTIRYQLRPDGYSNTADFYVYNSHFKAGNDPEGTDEARRNVEAQTNRANADALGANRHIIYAGDLNLSSGNEAAFTTLRQAGNGQAFDPTNAPLNWRDNSSVKHIHTQSPATVQAYPGQVVAGMDDRYDFQLITGPMNDAEGIDMIGGSYRVFGNNGTHPLNGAINSPSNTWNPPGLTVPASTVKNLLTQVSDHVPLVVDYQIPARMAVSVTAPPALVIEGASVTAGVLVSNTAPVVASIGADELDYTVNGGGSLSGSFNGSTLALTVGNQHVLSLNTSTPGVRSGTISVNSTSQAVANGSFTQSVSTTVLAHANPSFHPSIDADDLLIDFGIRARGSGSLSQGFSISNLAHASGFTAALDVDQVNATGDLGSLAANVGTFANLAAGNSTSFQATLETSSLGAFGSVYTLVTSDQDLPGAIDRETLTLILSARVAIAGDATLDDRVNLADFNILSANFGQTGRDWMSGDFTLDGLVNLADFNLLAANFGLSASPDGPTPDDWAALAAVVPEPGMAISAVVLLSGSALRPARRRRHA